MLDPQIIDQLKEVFSKLDSTVWLKASSTSHESFEEMKSMLDGLSQCSPHLKTEITEKQTTAPELEIHTDKFTGIKFRGVPGGHEFSSLVLSILHANFKGKRPDEATLKRIQNLKGPIRLRTYVSLSCENCPEVVQTLNLMASVHPDFEHETIDGAVAENEVKQLNIQGVPAVFNGSKMISSGKSSLIDLLSKLENEFGSQSQTGPQDLGHFDGIIIGGGPAGISSAIYLARKGLNIALVAERLGGQLLDTLGIENMISQKYTEGKKLAAELADHLAQYPVKVFEHRRLKTLSKPNPTTPFEITLESGETIHGDRLLVATGAQWRKLGVPGETEHIGSGVAFCAHCDGPFYKNKKVVVIGGGNSGVEAAIDLAQIASHVRLLEFAPELKADRVLVDKLKALPNTEIITHAQTEKILGEKSKVVAMTYKDRSTQESHQINTDGVFVQIGLMPNSQFLKSWVDLSPMGEIKVDEKGRTSYPGIYAAGDVTTIPFKQIITSMGDGAKTALTLFEDRMRQDST